MNKLYILPFDHRGSFAKMFGFKHGNLAENQSEALKDYKHIIYEGFLAALSAGISKDDGAILVDEEFGAEIHEEARDAGITRILTVEKSGQDEFDFEYGEKFKEHIEKIKPDYVKVLVRYNPRMDAESNRRQRERLKTLADFCSREGYKFLFELLAVPTEEDLKECGGKENYDGGGRWKVMIASVRELKGAGIEPDIWKLEGLDDAGQFSSVVEEARTGSNKEVGVVVLGRGESDAKVRRWLEVSAGIPGVLGMAVGRTIWSNPMQDFATKKISREEAAGIIAKNYKDFVDLFEASGGISK